MKLNSLNCTICGILSDKLYLSPHPNFISSQRDQGSLGGKCYHYARLLYTRILIFIIIHLTILKSNNEAQSPTKLLHCTAVAHSISILRYIALAVFQSHHPTRLLYFHSPPPHRPWSHDCSFFIWLLIPP